MGKRYMLLKEVKIRGSSIGYYMICHKNNIINLSIGAHGSGKTIPGLASCSATVPIYLTHFV
jgi:hypothetical protein